MRQLPNAKTKTDVDLLFGQLQIINDENINGKKFCLFNFEYMLLLIID